MNFADTENEKRTENFDRSNSGYDDKVASLFQPDTTLAAQYFDTLRRRTELYPEKTLMLAVLEDGINCFQESFGAGDVKNQKLLAETEEWIFGSDADWLFSFENVCTILKLNPDYLRKGLLRWKSAKLRQQEANQTSEANKLAS